MKKNLELEIKRVALLFLEKTKEKEIQIISHFETDGIVSAAMMIQTLKELDKTFTLKIVKNLEENFIKNLAKNKITLFLDLASGNLDDIKEADLKDVFIIDHHEIAQKIPENINIINPHLYEKQKISSSGLVYLFSKEINPKNKKFAKLAILGMVGDHLEKDIGKINNEILEDSEIKIKKGLSIYPAARPLNRALEFSSNFYLPGISGNIKEILELLREAGLTPKNGKYKSLLELNDEEMKKLTKAIMLRKPRAKISEIIGDIFLIKLYNEFEDARELSAKINACSRLGESGVAIQLCMEVPEAKKRAQSIHSKQKQELMAGLKIAQEMEKIEGEGFVIINAQEKIKGAMIGTITNILSNSSIYKEETIIVVMAYYGGKIKISARNVGNLGRDVLEILNNIVSLTGGEVGGHEFAAGCVIEKEKEQEFLECLKKNLEIEVIKVS
ncbi:MAG: archaea-specific RecJ-like protein exonuclease [archaeon GW2011_AR19]|nr:MAG: archaea-specific RecJ-like protein exonuclease [archaeon GW2011_AR19]